jgi:hypothetical protein
MDPYVSTPAEFAALLTSDFALYAHNQELEHQAREPVTPARMTLDFLASQRNIDAPSKGRR